MTNYLLLARGESLADAKVLAVSASPEVVGRFIGVLAGHKADEPEEPSSKEGGWPHALAVIHGERD